MALATRKGGNFRPAQSGEFQDGLDTERYWHDRSYRERKEAEAEDGTTKTAQGGSSARSGRRSPAT